MYIVLVLSSHGSINSQHCFLRGFGDHNFEEKSCRSWIPHILLYSVDTHVGERPFCKLHAALVIHRIKFVRDELF